MKKFYSLSQEESLSALRTSECGLTQKEAEERLAKYGEMCLKRRTKRVHYLYS